MVRATIEAKLQIAGVQRAPTSGRGSRVCPPRVQGESRGGTPPWQEVWRMCLHKPLLFSFPLPLQEGGQGDGPSHHRGQATNRRSLAEPRPPTSHCDCSEAIWGGAAPFRIRLGRAPPRLQTGESRGGAPLWQEVWRMCLHKTTLLYFPLPLQEGGQGDGPSHHRGQATNRRSLAEPRPPTSHCECSEAIWGGAAPFRIRLGRAPRACKRESRGVHPSGRRYGGCASILRASLLPPSS